MVQSYPARDRPRNQLPFRTSLPVENASMRVLEASSPFYEHAFPWTPGPAGCLQAMVQRLDVITWQWGATDLPLTGREGAQAKTLCKEGRDGATIITGCLHVLPVTFEVLCQFPLNLCSSSQEAWILPLQKLTWEPFINHSLLFLSQVLLLGLHRNLI